MNPFNVPGSPITKLGQKKTDARSKLIVAAVVIATVFLFSGLFMQGCQRSPATNAANTDNPAGTTPDANAAAMAAQPAATNTTGTPTADTASTTGTPSSTTTASAPTAPDAGTAVTPPAPPAGTKDYVVVKGDSFSKIAKANHISMKALGEANPGTDSSKLKIGQTIHLPSAPETAAATPASTSSTASSASSAGSSTAMALKTTDSSDAHYVVKSGDTLGRIAKAHGTTVKAIKVANGLTSDRIPVGKSLKLPPAKAPATSAA